MISVRLDLLETKEANIVKAARGEEVLAQYEVVPLDTNVMDLNTPTLFLTKSFLILNYDEILEIYNLGELDIEYLGNEPRFTIPQQLMEGKFYYSAERMEDLTKMRNYEELPRMAITEPNQVPKDYTLRNGIEVQKSYQVWSMVRMIQNIQRNQESEAMLQEMVEGNFTRFNQKTILAFLAIFGVYLVIKLLLFSYLPDLIDQILNFIFGALVIALGIWLWLTVSKNLMKFKSVYRGYTGWRDSNQPIQQPPNNVPTPPAPQNV